MTKKSVLSDTKKSVLSDVEQQRKQSSVKESKSYIKCWREKVTKTNSREF